MTEGASSNRSRMYQGYRYVREGLSSFVEFCTREPELITPPTPLRRSMASHDSLRSHGDGDGDGDEDSEDIFYEEMAELETSQPGPGPEMPRKKGILVADVKLPVNIVSLNEILFAPGSGFALDMHRRRGHVGYDEGVWKKGEEVEGGYLRRMLKFRSPARRLVRAYSCSEVQEYQSLHRGLVVVNTSARTPEVPAGECFTTDAQYVLRSLGPAATHLRITLTLNFHRPTSLKRVLCRGAALGARLGFRKSLEILKMHVGAEVACAECKA
eukprot:CAMPEP_0182853936 /NCGR_PEP_ID=MMETSP0034_2-20130328/967_1 /TAXON_ID=156128 /ORGANISM="Nephroselmis pyriformis, Strain CCMP717" /LENGTH=269 /DNA_ID=CAMNT_0024984723 /DNA_START=108 /DNA_END=917 /DNA_ORIENTATION=+